jgi:AraC family transcriptional regulator
VSPAADSRPPLLNPPPALLGRENALVGGRSPARGHVVARFVGPLSIKTVLQGEGYWRTPRARFRVDPAHLLVLGEGREYSLEIEPGRSAETLCAFFRRGFVAEALSGASRPDAELLDDPETASPDPGFVETLRPQPARLRQALLQARAAARGGVEPLLADELFGTLALELVDSELGVRRLAERLPAVRPGTRRELLRRLLRARDFIEAELASPLSLGRIAREACLSPYHCQRRFAALFGETPHAYATRRRLERAAAALHAGGRSVTEVCLDAGFASLPSFSALFRRRFGSSPGAYSRRMRKIREDPGPPPP